VRQFHISVRTASAHRVQDKLQEYVLNWI